MDETILWATASAIIRPHFRLANAFACRLAAETAIPAVFVRSDVYDWLADAMARGHQFDRVIYSYGPSAGSRT